MDERDAAILEAVAWKGKANMSQLKRLVPLAREKINRHGTCLLEEGFCLLEVEPFQLFW